MRLLLDMNMPRGIGAALREMGHDAVHLGERGQGHLADDTIFAIAASEQRVVVTFDLDFGKIAGLATQQGCPVILLRLRSVRGQYIFARLTAALSATAGVLSSPSIVVVEDARVRVRTLPPS